MIPDGSGLCSNYPSGGCPPLHRIRSGFECDSVRHYPSPRPVRLEPQRWVVRRPALRSVQLGPVLRRQLAREHSEAHWRLLRWAQLEPVRLEPQRWVARRPSLYLVQLGPAARQQLERQYSVARSVRSEPALCQQLAQEHLEVRRPVLRWVQLEPAARQRLERQYSEARSLRSVRFEPAPGWQQPERSAFALTSVPYRAVPVRVESEGARVLATRTANTLETTRRRRHSHSRSILRKIVDYPPAGRCPIA